MKRITCLALAALLLLGCVRPSQTPLPGGTGPGSVTRQGVILPPPTIAIISPAENSTLPAGTLSVSVNVTDFLLTPPGTRNVPGQGHIHFYLDVDIPTAQRKPAVTAAGTYQASPNATASWDNVLPGIHNFGVQLVNNDHTPLTPPLTANVNISVVTGFLKVAGRLNIAVGPEHITDVWAHTAPSGRSYAYLGSYDQPSCSANFTGVYIVDITDPTNPQMARFVPSPARTRVSDVVVGHVETPSFKGDILVWSVETCSGSTQPAEASGILLYDVTDPLNPKLLARNFLNFQVHNSFIYQQNKRAFVLVVQDGGQRDFHIVEITDPAAPKEVAARGAVDWFNLQTDQLFLGEMPVSFVHDFWAQVYPKDFPDASLAGKTIAYLSYWDAGLVILDITDPANQIFLGDSDYLNPDPLSGQPPEGNSHSTVPTADGKFVFMGDEDFSPTRTALTVDTGNFSGEYRAIEAGFTSPIERLLGKKTGGPVTFIGLGCEAGAIPPPDPGLLRSGEKPIALIERGICGFDVKIPNAAAAGYELAVVFNTVETPAQLIQMGGDRNKGAIPAVFVSRFTAFAALGIPPESPPSTPLPPVGMVGNRISINADIFDGWGYGRVLDVSDPANIREVGQYATPEAFARPVPRGDHSMHNVMIEGRRAYISWYWDGIRVADFSNPQKPVEIAFFIDETDHSNFWGVYLFKHPDGNTYILGSDRDSGLWIFHTPEAGTMLPDQKPPSPSAAR